MAVPKSLPVDGRVDVDGVEIDIDNAYADLKIDPTHVVQQLVDQPALYSYWSTLAEEADIILFSKKRRLELVEAELDDQLRREARDNDEKVGRGGVTESVIQRRIVREQKYQDALDALTDARRAAGYLGIIRRSLEQRLSALVAVNNRDRSEMAAVGREA